jgi:putative tricarboxylic transport membrane protein
MLIFGVIGYVFKKLNYPMAPLVLALVLGNNAESAFRQSMLASQGSLGILFSNGLVGGITTLSLVMLFWPLISKGLRSVLPSRATKVPAEQPVD